MTPETRYAKTSDGVHVAYEVVGGGPIDLVFVMGWTSNVEALWEEPAVARFFNRLGSFARLILFDKRGTGLSDRVPEDRLPSLEVRMDDARAVMDAVGSQRAIIFGVSEGGPMATLFAATYPARTIALALFGTSACWRAADDYPFPHSSDEEFERSLEFIDRAWGTPEYAAEVIRTWGAPSLVGDRRATEWLANYTRRAASPGAAIALARMNRGIDVRAALPAIHVPTLVMAREDDPDFPVEETRWMAERIRGATFVALSGGDHFFWVGDQVSILDEVERFVAATRGQEADLDRVLGTVLFTDIVGSTAKAVELGDGGWRDLVDQHHGTVRALLGRFRGREVDTSGDGFFATFDGPARAVRCAQAMTVAVHDLGIEIRAGVHTGELETASGQVRGIAVNIGARIGALAQPSEVRVSATVRDLVSGSGIVFEEAGQHELKGLADPWRLYRAVG
jgi:pimeloyl-ACP methyl ester carboxylesterase